MLGLAFQKISNKQKWPIYSMNNLNFLLFHIYFIVIFFTILKPNMSYAARKYTKEDILKLREEVREMFNHAYSGYLKYAYPYDELRPLTCDGVDTWGSYSLTLIDALDTLAVMGNYSEFRRVVDIVTSKANFDANINVSVFETNIRIVGGLLSAHLLSQRAGVELEPGWPCNGPLLRLAEDVAKRLIAAFDTMTGMPYGTVNLRYGVPPGETSITCTAGVGTYILEFGTLSRLTGDPLYEEVALNALNALYHHRSSIGLYGNHIDVLTGRWTAQDSGIGAGVDSYLEYLVKGALLVQRPELMAIFNEGRAAIDKHLRRNDWYLWVSMFKGQVTLPVFQSLEAYWPGVLSLIGDISSGMKSMHNYHQVWKQYGFTPEFYNIAQGQAGTNRESYPLRPELVESTMYLYRATGDPFLLDVGRDILRSIQHSSRTKCGYATIKDCRDHSLENRMESFFLAETTKYLYLLFDPDNFIHNNGQQGTVHTLPSGRECVLDAGGYIFNTEAHPLDPGALLCCSENVDEPKRYNHETARGEKFTSFVKKEQEEQLSSGDEQSSIDTEQEEMDASSASTTEEHHSTTEEDEFLEKLQESGAVDVLKLPPPSSEEVHSLDSELSNNKISLHTLEMIEIVIDNQMENHLLNWAQSQGLLREMINIIDSAEKSLKRKETEALKETGGTPHNDNFSNVKSENLSIPKETNTHNYNELNNNIPVSKEVMEETAESSTDSDLTGNSSKPEGRRRKSLFEQVIVQHFKTIKNTVITEAELIDFHIKKCTEILGFTKNLVNTSDGEDIATEFFTKRLDVMITASEIKKSIIATKKLLFQGMGEGVTLEFLKTLVDSIVDGRTLEEFLGKYKSYIEVVRKLIAIRKESLQKEAMEVPNVNENIPVEGDTNVDDNVAIEGDTNVDDNVAIESDTNVDEDESNYSSEDSGGFQDNWKADDISYQVDDREKVVPVSKIDNGPLFTDKLKFKTETVVGSLPKVLLQSETPFNPQVLLERIRADLKYPRNATWTTQYELLTCQPQPYFTRLMLSGEFFSD